MERFISLYLFSGAEIEQAIISALYDAFSEGMRDIETSDIIRSLTETYPISKTMSHKKNELRDWAGDRARFASLSEDQIELQFGGKKIGDSEGEQQYPGYEVDDRRVMKLNFGLK